MIHVLHIRTAVSENVSGQIKATSSSEEIKSVALSSAELYLAEGICQLVT